MKLAKAKEILKATLARADMEYALGAEPLKVALEAMTKLEKLEGAVGTVLAEADTYDDDDYGQGYKDAIEKVVELAK